MRLQDLLISTDKQVLFDTAVKGLAKQGVQALDENGGYSCQYITADGKKCAAGQVIREKHLSKLPSSSSFDFVCSAMNISISSEKSETLLNFMVDLQDAHDDNRGRKGLVNALRKLAQKYELSTAAVGRYMSERWQTANKGSFAL